MARLKAIEPERANGKTKQLLDAVHGSLGVTPNLMRTLANSPAALEAFLNFNAAVAGGALSGRLREQIALAVGELNQCQYCVSAHTVLGRGAGLSDGELASSRQSRSGDPKAEAALKFAKQVLASRGQITDDDFKIVRNAGFTDGEIVEIVAIIAINIFTNYFNQVAQTEIDFPKIELASGK